MSFVSRFLNIIEPVVKLTGKIHVPFSRKKVTGVHYYKQRDKINPGTVLMSSTSGEFSNIINPLKIKHAAVYIGMVDGIGYVIEATSKGVNLKDLVTFMTTKDLVIGLNPAFNSDYTKIRDVYKKYLGASYDYDFVSSNKTYYCYELIAKIYNEIYPNKEIKKQKALFGHEVYGPDSFLRSDHFRVIFNTEDK